MLLDQLLALARAQSASELPTSPVSVQSIYRRVLEDLMPLAHAKRIDIGVEGTQDAIICANELDMLTLVRNLVDNAIRYTHDGGRVDLSVQFHEGTAGLRIQDHGPGIPLTERERVFAPFYRTLGSAQTGSGLGLSIVQAIVQRLGGEIRLDFTNSCEQSGLSVIVRLPAK